MTVPSFQRKPEGWMQDPVQLAKHEKAMKELQERSKALPIDTRHLPDQERKLIEMQDEIKSLHSKVAEIMTENDELTELLKIAAESKRYKIPVRKVRGILDFVDPAKQEYMFATFDSNTNILEHLSID
jgi:chromosome segregation ATPase